MPYKEKTAMPEAWQLYHIIMKNIKNRDFRLQE